MARGKRTVSVLSAIACLAAALPAAYAGGGMGGAGLQPLGAPFSCRLILNAPNEPQSITIVDGFNSGDTVKVGAAVLYCQSAIATTVSGPATTLVATPDSLTCYNLGNADQAKDTITYADPFGTQTVTTGGISVFCVPAVLQSFQP